MPTPRPFNTPVGFSPNISPLGEITRQVERMKALNPTPTTSSWNPLSWFKGKGFGAIKEIPSAIKGIPSAIKSAPGVIKGAAVSAAGPAVAQSAGLYIAGKLVQSAGTPGAARMSTFGLGPTGTGSDAPVYQTPFNDVSSSGGVTRIGGKEYDLSDPTQKAAYDKVIAADRASRPGQKFADLRGGGGLNPDGSGRTMPAPDGNNSSGTNTGFKGADFGEANGLLARLGITSTRYGDFQSNDLPGVENTEFGGSDREIFGGTAEEDRIIQGGGSLETVIDAKQTQGSPKLTQSGAQSITSTVETAPLGSLQRYGQEFMADRPDMPADKSTSMTGLRAAEASKGLLYASGKYWKENPSAGKEGQKDFIEIQKDEWNSIKRGEQHAQEFLQQKMGPVKSVISLTDKQDDYQISDASKPTSSIDSTVQVEPSQITNAPTLTDAVDVSFTDKDRSGRYNLFR